MRCLYVMTNSFSLAACRSGACVAASRSPRGPPSDCRWSRHRKCDRAYSLLPRHARGLSQSWRARQVRGLADVGGFLFCSSRTHRFMNKVEIVAIEITSPSENQGHDDDG